MAVGNSAAVLVSGLNNQLGNLSVQLRNTCSSITDLWEYIVSLGANETAQVAALAALSGWQVTGTGAAADPQTFWTQANYMFAVSQLYFGLGTQGSAFNYDSGLAPARGGS